MAKSIGSDIHFVFAEVAGPWHKANIGSRVMKREVAIPRVQTIFKRVSNALPAEDANRGRASYGGGVGTPVMKKRVATTVNVMYSTYM